MDDWNLHRFARPARQQEGTDDAGQVYGLVQRIRRQLAMAS